MMTTMEPQWMKTEEAAALLRVTRQTVRRWIQSGRIKAVKLSPGKFGIVRVNAESVRALLRMDKSA